jgi:hypothetical protein
MSLTEIRKTIVRNDSEALKKELINVTLSQEDYNIYFRYACINGSSEIIEILIKKYNIDIRNLGFINTNNINIVRPAIQYKRFDIFKQLIDADYNGVYWFDLYDLIKIVIEYKSVDAYDILLKIRNPYYIISNTINTIKKNINIFDRLIQYVNYNNNFNVDQLKKYRYDRRAYTLMIDVPEELNDIICEYFVWNR